MNEATLNFHLKNIEKNNRFEKHKKDLEEEISSLRLSALNLKGTSVSRLLSNRADIIARKLDSAMVKRLIA